MDVDENMICFPQAILNAIGQNDVVALDVALDVESRDLFRPRPFVFRFDTHKTLVWNLAILDTITKDTSSMRTCNPQFEVVIDIDLLTLALHFASVNVDVVDQLLLRGHSAPIHPIAAEIRCVAQSVLST